MLTLLGNPQSLLGAIAVCLFCYTSALSIYRLYFHKLSRFPGPKLAALTWWYDFYYDVYLKGQFVFKLEELHKRYGPIVRISPEEIHILDPDFYVEFFTRSGPQSKYERSANAFNNPTSTFSTVAPDHHKLRRGALENMFSRQQVRHLLPTLQEKVAKMLFNLGQYAQSREPVRIDRAMYALSEDMIFEYGFGISRNALDKPGFQDPLHEVFTAAGSASALCIQFPIVPKIIDCLPDSLIGKLQPDMLPLIKMKQVFQIELDAFEDPENVKALGGKGHRTVMLDLLQNAELHPSERSRQRMLDESQLVIGAGLSTTGWAATVGLYHILANPEVLHRIREELYTAIPKGTKRKDCTDLDWAQLESLPYYQACIRETLRLSYGMSSRNTRRTHQSLTYTESDYVARDGKPRTWSIPPYTPVSQSIPLINHNEHIFPDSYRFKPERWMGLSKVPERYFLSFSKGPRMCLGMQLAQAELALMLAGALRWFEMELYQTDESAVRMVADVIIPIPADNTGLQVKVIAELE